MLTRPTAPLAFLVAGLLLRVVSAESSASTDEACEKLADAVPNRVIRPFSIDYYHERKSYWSVALRSVRPACVVQPQSPQDVADAVRVLLDYPDVQFAVKSGGHDPNYRHASIEDGVLISMTDLAGVTYDKEKGLAYLKPGGEWSDAITALNEENVTLVGGRLGVVGIGGYLLGGGLSFLSSQYGMAADSIVSWEVVTANGSIVNVHADEDPDLAVAMRGGGSQFGIVTQFTVKTHPIGQIWGGNRVYRGKQIDQVFAALHDFVPTNKDDTKAAVIVNGIYVVGGINFANIFYYYGAPEPPTTGPLAKFLAIKAIADTTSTRSYPDLLDANSLSGDLYNARMSFRTITIPYVRDAPHMYAEMWDKFGHTVEGYLAKPLRLTSQCSLTFQPFPAVIGEHSQASGGNAMGLSGDHPDRLIVIIQCGWASRVDDDIIHSLTEEVAQWIEAKLPEWTRGEEHYLPLFMNDAAAYQNVTGSYRDYGTFKALQASVDPDGFFSSRGGGFTY